jgi:hypothetical protein
MDAQSKLDQMEYYINELNEKYPFAKGEKAHLNARVLIGVNNGGPICMVDEDVEEDIKDMIMKKAEDLFY